jgi:hypothetical protein
MRDPARRALPFLLALGAASCFRGGLYELDSSSPDSDADSDSDSDSDADSDSDSDADSDTDSDTDTDADSDADSDADADVEADAEVPCPGVECGGRCYGPGECVDACTWTLAEGWGACSDRFRAGPALPDARTLDLAGLTTAEVCISFCDPTGFSFHFADSPTCNGYAGDSGQFSNDAELQLDGTTLALFANDYGTAAAEGPWTTDFMPNIGCTDRILVVTDGSVTTATGFEVASPYALRLDPPADDEGAPDRLWYVGPNGAVGGGRTGSGVVAMHVCLR